MEAGYGMDREAPPCELEKAPFETRHPTSRHSERTPAAERRRNALRRACSGAVCCATLVLSTGCELQPQEPEDREPGAVSLQVTPEAVELEPGETAEFSAQLRDSQGQPADGTVSWSATGGSIDSHGRYTAGSAPGEYRIVASDATGLADTSTVAIAGVEKKDTPGDPPTRDPPIAASLKVSPADAEVQTRGTLLFSAELRDQYGDPFAGTVSWSATGGTIDSEGRYTGPANAGTHRVIASGPEGLADTALVTVVQQTFDVLVEVGEDIQSLVDANPAGTSFLILRGTHRGQSIHPKDGMTFVLEDGAILDGVNTAPHAFRGAASNVTIRGGVIERYANRAQYGAIHARKGTDLSPSERSKDWLIEGVEVRNNAGVGIMVGDRTRVRDCHIHHNEQLGIGGTGDDIVVEDNEISYNNPNRAYSAGWEAGGAKFVFSRNAVLRGNHVHHNQGPGIWLDRNNIDVLYDGNLVTDNAGPGIFHEVSYRAVIRNNEVRRNAVGGQWLYAADILVAHSPDVEVHDNVVETVGYGIAGIQQDRPGGLYGPHLLSNLWVHDNLVYARAEGAKGAGVAQDVGDAAVFRSQNNRFDRNTYYLGSNAKSFAWEDALRDVAAWQGYGHDLNGAFNR